MSTCEFAVNNSYHENLQTTPFFLNYGFHPKSTYITHSREAGSASNPSAVKMKTDMQLALVQARDALKKAQDRYKLYADKHRRDIEYKLGDSVLLSTKNIKIRGKSVSKLMPRFMGPYEIIQRVGKVAYKLKLPPTSKIFPVFHVLLLKKYKVDPTRQPPSDQTVSEPLDLPEGHFVVEKVLDHQLRKKPGKKKNKKVMHYLIKWEGYPSTENSYEPEQNLTQVSIDEYWRSEASRGRPVEAAGQARQD